MLTNDNRLSVASVGLSSELVSEMEGAECFFTLHEALRAVRSRGRGLIVLTQPSNWSLDRTGREVSEVVGDHAAIVLSPDGTAFAPRLFVVDHKIPVARLISLITRVARHAETSSLTAAV